MTLAEKEKQTETNLIKNVHTKMEETLLSGTQILEQYLEQHPDSFTVAETIGDYYLFLVKMPNEIDFARKAGNNFLHAADLAAREANEGKIYDQMHCDMVKRNLSKAKNSFEIYGSRMSVGKELVNKIDFQLSFFDKKFNSDISIAFRRYSDFKISSLDLATALRYSENSKE
ncbi:MAG: hypothetical protein ABSD68_02500 [Candidatus Micrarchaeales archaeon]|jgi:hypothetical protein